MLSMTMTMATTTACGKQARGLKAKEAGMRDNRLYQDIFGQKLQGLALVCLFSGGGGISYSEGQFRVKQVLSTFGIDFVV